LSSPAGKGAYAGIVNAHPTSASSNQNIQITNNDISSMRFGIYGRFLSGGSISGNEIHNPANFYQQYMYGIYISISI